MTTRPLIWVLKGIRAGDSAQAMELAQQLGGDVEAKKMAFNETHAIPNWLLGARVSHLTADAKQLLHPPWPDVVVATGRRTAPAALWIKKHSNGKTKLVHIGRPRMAVSGFDAVVTTPQYGLPEAENCVVVPVPFASPKAVAAETLQHFNMAWADLPRPWILAVVGGGKFPVQMDAAALADYGQALQQRAAAMQASVILVDSPRSPPDSLSRLAQHLSVPHWQFKRGDKANPYQAALQLCDELIVTSDSVSMTTEMLRTGKPAWIFRLPVSRWRVQWHAQSGLGAMLARRGILHPPRNVDGFMESLLDAGLIGDLRKGQPPHQPSSAATLHQHAVLRIKSVLKT